MDAHLLCGGSVKHSPMYDRITPCPQPLQNDRLNKRCKCDLDRCNQADLLLHSFQRCHFKIHAISHPLALQCNLWAGSHDEWFTHMPSQC